MMRSDHVEIEATYSAPAESGLPSLAELVGVAEVDPPVSQVLVADYFDTYDLRLAWMGVTLRKRTGGDDPGWHLKVPAAGARYDVHDPLTTDQAPPAPVVEALTTLTRGRRLTPMVTITTRRTLHRLRDAGGSILAEVADDRVTARSTLRDVVETAWREWEAELVDGDTGLLMQVLEKFERAGAARASHSSKVARALGDSLAPVSGEARNRGRSHHRAQGVVRARLRDQVRQLLRWDVLLRRDVDDAVHQMRVAVRRLRSALATNRPMFQRERTEPLRAELKWLASLLGGARDAEVLRDRIGHLAAEEDGRLVDPAAVSSAQDELTRRYRDKYDQLVQELNSARYATLVDKLELLITDPPWAPTAHDQKFGALLKRVRHDWKRLVAAVASADRAADAQTRQQRLHDARKAAKRARYAAEPLIPAYGTGAARFVKATTKLQTTLGDLHDAIVTMEELQQLAAKEAVLGHNVSTLTVLHSREQADAAKLETQFQKAWRKARRRKGLRWLT